MQTEEWYYLCCLDNCPMCYWSEGSKGNFPPRLCECVHVCVASTSPTPLCTIFRPVWDSRKFFSDTVWLKAKNDKHFIIGSGIKDLVYLSGKLWGWRNNAPTFTTFRFVLEFLCGTCRRECVCVRVRVTGFSSHLRGRHVVFILADTEGQRRTYHTGDTHTDTHTHTHTHTHTGARIRWFKLR